MEKEMATHSSVLASRTRDRGAWWAALHRVAQSWTRLKRLSSSSNRELVTGLKSQFGYLIGHEPWAGDLLLLSQGFPV